MNSLIMLAVGIVAGISGGLFGIGGGIVIVPALIWSMGYSQKQAQGTSLVALLAPVGLLGLMNYYRDGYADLRAGAWIAAGFFGGAFLGSKLALSLDESLLRRAFALFLVFTAAQLWFRK